MRILIAEDDGPSRRMLAVSVAQLGHEVDAFEGGDEAWAAWQVGRHPVVITDWRMPGADGLELCGRIRQDKAPTYTYVILLTGHGDRESFRRAMHAGVDDFLAKPLELDRLEARLLVASRVSKLRGYVQSLETILNVCGWCKRIHDVDAWIPMQEYVERQTGAQLSHGLCPHCATAMEAGVT